MSGAYVEQELAVEFGQMPPSFLPVGTQRLYEYQFDRIGEKPIYLTVPETYDIPLNDCRRLRELGAVPVSIPDGLSLGEAIVFAVNIIGGLDQPIWILHGDTLISDMPSFDVDVIGITSNGEGYSWAEIELEGDRITGIETVQAGALGGHPRPIACGYFAFASTVALIRGITRARGNFIAGIMDYAKDHVLKAITIDTWHDFGHVQTFFRSRRIVTSARHFNTLHINNRTARKSSKDVAKIRSEAAWFISVPPPVRIYSARLIDSGDDADGQAFYETEYGYLPTLSELFTFGALGPSAWSNIMRSCKDFLSACAAAHTELVAETADQMLFGLMVTKTASRLHRFAEETGFDVDRTLFYNRQPVPSLMQIALDTSHQIDFASGRRTHVMHGDFCFSNILYDSRMQRIRVIDPRGYLEDGQPSISGDLRYDMAKFVHSIIGRYDQIIAGRYRLDPPNGNHFFIELEQLTHHAWLEDMLDHFVVDGVCAAGRAVLALSICLFLSMLPLHSERPDRQRAFIANALRLFVKLEANTT